MSDPNPLIVPMRIEAFVVNDHVRMGNGNAFVRTDMRYGPMFGRGVSGQPGLNDSDPYFGSAELIPRNGVTPTDYYNGVYLKWRLPKAFAHGVQDNVAGTTVYPPVPNRWLVVRNGGPLGARQASAWIVESDYVWPQNRPVDRTIAELGSLYVGAGEPDTAPAAIFMGRNIPLGAQPWSEPGTSLKLTAVAPGNPAFAFYQPACNNVFSFVDVMGNGPAQTLSYLVLGWFSSAADDPLAGTTTSDGFAKVLERLGWTVPQDADTAAAPTWSLLAGSLTGVQWQPDTLPGGGAPSNIPGRSPVSVAVGNTAVEALTALITAQGAPDLDAVLLEAFQLDMVEALDEPDGAARLAEAIHTSCFKRYTGGYDWQIVAAPGSTGSPDAAELEQEQLLLAALRQAQGALDAARLQLVSLQLRLYVMWWKYEVWNTFVGPAVMPGLSRDALDEQLDPDLSGSLADQTAQQAKTVAALASAVPDGSTPDALAAAIAAYAAAQGLPAGRQLKRIAGPRFYLPNDPVVLIAGAGASNIADDPQTVQCRRPSELVTGVLCAGTTVSAATPGLTIPQPNLSGVSNVPWSPSLAQHLVDEFFLLDPDSATMIAAAIPHGDPQAIATAVQDPANASGTYPAGSIARWAANPWRPLRLLWEADYYPLPYGTVAAPNWTFEAGRYVLNAAADGVDRRPDGTPQPPMGLSGLIQLATTASYNMQARINAFLTNDASLTPDEKAEFEALLQFVQSKDQWDLLSQALDGFNGQLRLEAPGVFKSPASGDRKLSADLPALIGTAFSSPPALDHIPPSRKHAPESRFQPWRAGQFTFTNLLVVDEWGQALWPIDDHTAKTAVVYVPAELAPVTTTNAKTFTIGNGTTISSAAGGGPVIGNLSPDLIQAGRVPSDELEVTVTGASFADGAIAQWDGTPVRTLVAGATQLVAWIPAAYLAAAAIHQITVVSSGVTSAPAAFTVSSGPAIDALEPSAAAAGGAAFTLTVKGVGFVPSSTVVWNTGVLPTTFVDANTLTVVVPAESLATTGSATVTVTLGSSVLPDAPASIVQLPPALLQPARLDFALTEGSAPDDPICGWVLPNHLDMSLVAYDAGGNALGELSVDITVSNAREQQQVCWIGAPGAPPLSQITADIPHFGPFLLSLSQQSPDAFQSFLNAVDETLWTTMPKGAVFDQSLAVLVGRPLALVRGRLQFALDGPPYPDPSWQYTFDPRAPEITTYRFAIELGNAAQIDDGLIGYFTEDDSSVFNVVQRAGADASGFLAPIGAGRNDISLPFDERTALNVSMLVDPRAPVHATTSILPVQTVALAPEAVDAALARMDVMFRIDGFLTDQQPAADGSPVTILMPVPREKTGTWTWLEDEGGSWTTYPTAPNDTTARLSDVLPVLRRGVLRLKSGL